MSVSPQFCEVQQSVVAPTLRQLRSGLLSKQQGFARVKGEERLGEVRQLVGLQAQGSKSKSRPNPSNPKSRRLNSQMGSRPGGRARSDGGRGARGPRGRFTARLVPALLLLATGSLLLHLLLAGPAPPGAAAQPQPGALPGPEAGRARPLPRCATALVASDACRVRPADGKLVFRDPTVTVQRDGREAVEARGSSHCGTRKCTKFGVAPN